MKPFIIGIASLLLSVIFYSFLHDYNLNHHNLMELKEVCVEASVAGSLFIDNVEYGNGRIVFNKVESTKAIEAVLQTMLNLDSDLNPTEASYWENNVNYKVYFFDDSNTSYPYLFVDSETNFTSLIKHPTVSVTINAGKAKYSLSFLKSLGNDNIRSGAHTWEGR